MLTNVLEFGLSLDSTLQIRQLPCDLSNPITILYLD